MGSGNLDKPRLAVKELAVWAPAVQMSPLLVEGQGRSLDREPSPPMNDLPIDIASSVLLSLPGFRLYALCVIVLILKMYFIGFYTGATRGRVKSTLNPEDARTFGSGQAVEVDHPDVARVLRAHRNDLENIPVFLVLGLVAVMVGIPVLGLRICLIVYTAARVAHTITYLRAMQPWRSISYGTGLFASLAMMVMIVIKLFS
jgi:microsomal prostaglandin-E synthase 1